MNLLRIRVERTQVRRDKDARPSRVGVTTFRREPELISVEEAEEVGDFDVIRVFINENAFLASISAEPVELVAFDAKRSIASRESSLSRSRWSFKKDNVDESERSSRPLKYDFAVL